MADNIRISPQGYVYGEEPLSDHPFWEEEPGPSAGDYVKEVSGSSATQGTVTTYSIKYTDQDDVEHDVIDIPVDSSGGGGGSVTPLPMPITEEYVHSVEARYAFRPGTSLSTSGNTPTFKDITATLQETESGSLVIENVTMGINSATIKWKWTPNAAFNTAVKTAASFGLGGTALPANYVHEYTDTVVINPVSDIAQATIVKEMDIPFTAPPNTGSSTTYLWFLNIRLTIDITYDWTVL